MGELKRCRCGRENPNVLYADLGVAWVCLVGCLNINCDYSVIRWGFSKKHAARRAARAWNRSTEDGTS